MIEQVIPANSKTELDVSSNQEIEVSFGGKMKWTLKSRYGDHEYAIGFLNHSSYVIKIPDTPQFLVLVLENNESFASTVYSRSL